MPKTVEFDSEQSEQIVSLREDGKKWDEISNEMDMPPGKCILIFNHATVAKKDRIKNAEGPDIVKLRDEESLSWGVISARTGYPESSCRKLYEDESGHSTKGNRIGKGGRYPDGSEKPEKASKPKAASKKSAAKKAPAKGIQIDWDQESDDVKGQLEGYAVKVDTGDGEEVVKIATVKRVNAKTVGVVDETGTSRTLKKASVTTRSKNKVLKG